MPLTPDDRPGRPGRGHRGWLRGFAAERRGNVAIIFALASLPLLAFTGAAIDYGLATRLQVKLQAATDATALNLCQTPQSTTSDTLQSEANTLVTGYMANASNLVVDALAITSNPRKITITTHVNSRTFFPAFTRVTSPLVNATSQCATPLPKTFEIALVLDNTGSMANSGGSQSKLDAAKTAASEFIDYVKGNDAFAADSRIAIVPFAASVALDPSKTASAKWVDSNGLSKFHWTNVDKTQAAAAGFKSRFDIFDSLAKSAYSGWSWAGCFETLPYPQNVSDGTPTDNDSLYVPMFAPDEPGQGSAGAVCWNSDGSSRCYSRPASSISYNSYINDTNKTNGCNTQSDFASAEKQACKYKNPVGAVPYNPNPPQIPNGPNYECTTKPLQRLTTDAPTLKSLISSMVAAGSTNIHEGVMWGWRALSPISVLADGSPYSTTTTNKVLILMTDGANSWTDNANYNYNQTLYFSNGYLKNADGSDPTPRMPKGFQAASAGSIQTSTQQRNALDQLTLEACTNAKATGISIYTIGFSVPSDPIDNQGIQLLQSCASNPKQAFVANDSTGLIGAFSQIAASIGALRISQ